MNGELIVGGRVVCTDAPAVVDGKAKPCGRCPACHAAGNPASVAPVETDRRRLSQLRRANRGRR